LGRRATKWRRTGAAIGVLALLGALGAVPVATAQDQPPGGSAPSDQRPESSMVLLFDSSGSMRANDGTGSTRIERAKSAIRALVDGAPPEAQIGLRVFGGRFPREQKAQGCNDSRLLLPVGPVDKAATEEALDRFKPLGYTPIALSLRRAADDLPTTGRRTIILVSDGQETCGEPPCDVARVVARRGVELKIQTIGFQVNRRARQQLKCIARVGGGVYRDVQDAPRLAEELRALSVRALRDYVPRGRPVQGGERARDAAEIGPGQWLDSIGPDEERWYYVELGERETLESGATLIPKERRGLETVGASFTLQILTPRLTEAETNNAGAEDGISVFDQDSEGGLDSIGVVGRPVAVGDQAPAPGGDPTDFSKPGRYYLRVTLEDNSSKDLFTKLEGKPVPLELLVSVLGRKGGEGSRATGSGGPDPGAPTPSSGSPAAEDDDGPSALVIAVACAIALAAGMAAAAGMVGRRRPA
jgi:Ca-activated chloride channel family protein